MHQNITGLTYFWKQLIGEGVQRRLSLPKRLALSRIHQAAADCETFVISQRVRIVEVVDIQCVLLCDLDLDGEEDEAICQVAPPVPWCLTQCTD
jgi:hypothetical protein